MHLVLREAVGRFDARIDHEFAAVRGRPLIDRACYSASQLGDWSLIWHLVSMARLAANPRRKQEILRLSGTLAIESILVNQGIKRLFNRGRPLSNLSHPHALRQPTTSSFPSGHASSAACAAVLLVDAQPALAPVWVALASVVALSRIHVRIHHASDVVGGLVVGTAIGLIVRKMFPLTRHL